MIGKYHTLRSVLKTICNDAPKKYKRYYPEDGNLEKVNQAYARAYIHLFIKVKFGILDFEEREHFITDGSQDGGVDAYYIHKESKTIFLVQSKFRTSEFNFEEKAISIEEILSMDLDRILEGETVDEMGKKYNGKIHQLQREISEVPDIGRYSYKVVILANVNSKVSDLKLKRLSAGLPINIINYKSTYQQLLFPVIKGEYYTASELTINVKLTDKSTGSKISYTVRTEYSDCDITVLFIPTIEIGRIMNEYKNSILKYNPRSYLEIQGQNVNSEIERTMLTKSTNEFALYNNGITMLSDETSLNEKIGQREKAQLIVRNPQIINGGQTAYTLSRIYQDNLDNLNLFEDKEVLLKVITIHDESISDKNKLKFIQEISRATNLQSVVTNADRQANDDYEVWLQDKLFDKLGIFYERKRGQYSDGVLNGYIKQTEILTRTVFVRLMLAAKGDLAKATQIQKKVPFSTKFDKSLFEDEEVMDRLKKLFVLFSQYSKDHANDITRKKIGSIIRRINTMVTLIKNDTELVDINILSKLWTEFIDYAKVIPENQKFFKIRKTKVDGNIIETKYFHQYMYLSSGNVKTHLEQFRETKL